MNFHPVWIVWILARISLVLCQDGIGTDHATRIASLSEASKSRDFEAATSEKPVFTVREEQIEDELANGATTTEKFMEKRVFMTKPSRENNEYREIFTVRYDDPGPTTVRSGQSSSKRTKASFSSSFDKYDEPEGTTDGDGTGFTTAFDGLAKKPPIDNGERKHRQRADGSKGVTTNRGRTRFQNEPGTSEVPEITTTLRHKKPIRVKPVELLLRDEVVSTPVVDYTIDTTTVAIDINSETEQQRPKFKKPPLIATHHPNFGTSTESSRRPPIRANLNLKQKIASSTTKTRPSSESDVTESENVPSNKTIEVVTSSIQINKIRPVKANATKEAAAQQPIPPTATAWALASLKAPNNTNRTFRKPLNATGAVQEQISKIKPFVTWSTRLQKTNEDNANSNSTSNITSITESNEPSAELSTKYTSTEFNRLTPEITSTESLIHVLSTLSEGQVPSRNDSTASMTVGGDTDQNKYEVYGSQRPEVENTTTVIETLRPSSSTTSSESQNLNLLLVTSYKSIFENNNASDVSQNVFTSSENPVLVESTPNKDVTIDDNRTTTDSSVVQNSAEAPITENVRVQTFSETQTSPDISLKIPGNMFDYESKTSTSTIQTRPEISSDTTLLFSSDIDLDGQNRSTTTEHYIDDIKTKLDGKITKSTDNRDSLEMVDFTHLFTSERPAFSSTEGSDIPSVVSEKTTSEIPIPSNEISNTSQVPIWSNSPDTFVTDFDAPNSTESHDNAADHVSKMFESTSQSSVTAKEATSEPDISENDVPVLTTSSTTSTTSTTTSTTTTTTTTQRPTTTTTPRPTTTTTTTTTPRPTTTTTTTPRPTTTTTTTTQRPTTTITPRPSRRKTTTHEPIILETTTTSTTTTTLKPKTSTTTTVKPNSITSRPKPTAVDTTTSDPNEAITVQSFLKVSVNSTMKDVCQSEDELKDAIIKLFKIGTESVHTKNQIRFLNVNGNDCLNPNDKTKPVGVELYLLNSDGEYDSYVNEEFVNLLDGHRIDYKSNILGVEFMKRTIERVNPENDNGDSPTVKTAIYLSCVAGFSVFLILILLIVRKRQKRFNYGQRCTPVSLDDYSMDNISVYNSVRRKGAMRASKRSYGNPAFDDSTAVSHPLNFAGLASFSEDRPAIDEEFSNVPVITVKPDELPPGAETKNRYANVIPMPETRVVLSARGGSGHQNSDYINANYVKGYKGAEKFYIACQAPMQSTLPDFWQMIWEQNTRVIMMLTSLTEKGVERCADYLPPSEVVDCHRLFGDYQVTLKKREVKDRLVISSLQLKNLETNLWRDVTHLWYGGWPVQGVPSDPNALLAFLMEARSHMHRSAGGGPHVVHCSPGTGRTGTVIACDVAVREFEATRTVDVPKTVYAVRRCRAGAVQTRDQYALIYKVVNLYASKLSGGVLDSI